jgi:hypothetical protein
MILPKEEREKRLEICRKCEHFKPDSSRCGVCGCFMKIKTALAVADCPKSYWDVLTLPQQK